MNEEQFPEGELLELASRQCNGQLDAASAARLESLLADNPAARRAYLHYVFLHAHLATSDLALEAVFDEQELKKLTAAERCNEILLDVPQVSLAALARENFRPRHVLRRTLLVSAAALLLLVPGLLLLNFVAPPGEFTGKAKSGSVAKVTSTTGAQWDGIDSLLPGQPLWPGTLRLSAGQASLRIGDAASVAFAGPAMFGVESESTASLFSGKLLARLDRPQAEPFVLQARGVRVVDHGTEFGVDVEPHGVTEVHCFEGEVETLSRVRWPLFYWSFDEEGGPVLDDLEGQPALTGAGAQRVAGLVGRGAMSFDNTPGALVNVGNGGGTQLGAGRFGVSRGITIEALVVVRWTGDGASNGKPPDYDEIFRKEDGVNRLLLAFQNDRGAEQRTIPPIEFPQPTLAFGLYLAADGYSELEVPLDGRDGHPPLDALRDGQPHHIVATYDSWTGVKALYIDGRLCQRAKFPDGSLIIGGGPTDAIVGNMAGGGEPFNGIIDEVAIYDFALSPEEIAEHARNASVGVNYLGVDAPQVIKQELWEKVTRLKAGQAMRFDSETGVSLGAIPLDKPRFRRELPSAKP